MDSKTLQKSSFIPTPLYIANKSCVINVRNMHDELCFIYSILAVTKRHEVAFGAMKRQGLNRAIRYSKYLKEIKFDSDKMPMRIEDIPHFESKNPRLAINVIKYECEDLSENHTSFFKLVYKSRYFKDPRREAVCLLMIGYENKFHYLAITNLNRLLNHNKTDMLNIVAEKWCPRCLQSFSFVKTFNDHPCVSKRACLQ